MRPDGSGRWGFAILSSSIPLSYVGSEYKSYTSIAEGILTWFLTYFTSVKAEYEHIKALTYLECKKMELIPKESDGNQVQT